MTVPQLVVLDLAGTTLDDGGAILTAFRVALERMGIAPTPEELNAARGANKLQVLRSFATRAYGPSPEAVQAAREGMDLFNEELAVQLRDGDVQPFDGVPEALMALKESGLRLASNTGLSRPLAEAVLRRFRRFSELFDAHVCGDDVPAGRPAPYMVFLAMERTSIQDTRSVVVVGDTPLDLQAGTNAGAAGVIGVLSGTHDVTTLGPTRHTHIIPSVVDLPELLRAEFGAESMAAMG